MPALATPRPVAPSSGHSPRRRNAKTQSLSPGRRRARAGSQSSGKLRIKVRRPKHLVERPVSLSSDQLRKRHIETVQRLLSRTYVPNKHGPTEYFSQCELDRTRSRLLGLEEISETFVMMCAHEAFGRATEGVAEQIASVDRIEEEWKLSDTTFRKCNPEDYALTKYERFQFHYTMRLRDLYLVGKLE